MDNLKNQCIVSFILICVLILTTSCSDSKTKINNDLAHPQSKINLQEKDSDGLVNPNQTSQPQNLTPLTQLCNITIQPTKYNGLISPRIYSGLLEPNSYLITNFDPLKTDLQNYLQNNKINASIYIENLRNGVNMGINQNRGYFPASLNKLPVAVIILQDIEDGKLNYSTILTINKNEKSSASGTLYLSNEAQMSVKTLLDRMLTESDNTAFNVLYDYIDKDNLRNLLRYYDVKINLDYPYRRLEFVNHTDQVTAISMYNLFSSLYLSTVFVDPKNSEYILSSLTNSEFDIKRIANLPDNVTVAQKYGEYYADSTKQFHDCGIMYIGQSRIFYCIMTKDMDAEDAKAAIGFIVNHIYNHVLYERSELENTKNRNGKIN